MKKSIRIVSVVVLALMLCLSLTSCFGNKLSGKYEVEVGGDLSGYTATYEFSGSKVEVTKKTKLLGSTDTTVIEGTYEITGEDDDLEITFTFEEEDEDIKSKSYTFEELENGNIKIGLVEYKKVED